jgi:hypothetical protein
LGDFVHLATPVNAVAFSSSATARSIFASHSFFNRPLLDGATRFQSTIQGALDWIFFFESKKYFEFIKFY